MISNHTAGKIELDTDGEKLFIVSGDLTIARIEADKTEHDANRLVSCWNACESLADPSVVPELVEALKGFAHHGCFTGDCPHEKQSQCLEDLAVTSVVASNALAKAVLK